VVNGLALGMLAALTALGVWLNYVSGSYDAQIADTITVQKIAQATLTLGVDAETGQRGYLLTNDQRFLEPYRLAQGGLADSLSSLEALTADSPQQSGRLKELRAAFAGKMAELDRTIDLARAGDRQAALAAVQSGEGRRLMDDIRARIRDFTDGENAFLDEREAQARRIRQWAFLPAILVGLVLLILYALEAGRSRREMRTLTNANIGLEEKVRERTLELEREAQRVQALLGDATHRVGNNLAIVAGLIGLQARNSRDPAVKEALAAVRSRVDAIAQGQRRFQLKDGTDDVDCAPQIEALAEELQKLAAPRGIAVETRLESVVIDARQSLSLIVLINELATNSLKHGFHEGTEGAIVITLAAVDNGVRLSVEDNGMGGAAVEKPGSMGQKIVKLMLQSLGAELRTEVAAKSRARPGHRTIVTVPRGNPAVPSPLS
jgi:two-component sensor histidine kinase